MVGTKTQQRKPRFRIGSPSASDFQGFAFHCFLCRAYPGIMFAVKHYSPRVMCAEKHYFPVVLFGGTLLLSGGAVWREHYSRRVMLLEKHYSPDCASPTVFTAIWARDLISEPKNLILLTFPIGFGRESWFLVPLLGRESSWDGSVIPGQG